jgi:predicted RNA-binding Zn-ribbon protein involved in translation (DUF1610 family)
MPDLSFYDIAKSKKFKEFSYTCSCGTVFGLKKRISTKKRHCPQCGELVTIQNIDQQVSKINEEYNRKKDSSIGCLGWFFISLIGLVILLAIIAR